MSKRARCKVLKILTETQMLLVVSSITGLFLLTMAYAETIRIG